MDSPHTDPPKMSRRGFWLAFIAAMVVFFVAGGLVWDSPFDIDSQVYWSYAAVPVLVIGMLLWEGKLGWLSFLLDSLHLGALKFAVTYFIAVGMWWAAGAPAPGAPMPSLGIDATEESARLPLAPPPSQLPGARRDVQGRVVNGEGQGVEGAWVFVSEGLEGLVFEPVSSPLMFNNNGSGFGKGLFLVQAYQDLQFRSADGQLHTAALEMEGRSIMNIPVLAAGQPRTVRLTVPQDELHVRCRVHREQGHTPTLKVIAHPFFVRSGADGTFTLHDVPEQATAVGALGRQGIRRAVAAMDPSQSDLILTFSK